MKLLRKLLFPLAVLYGWVTQLRNFLYDKGVFGAYRFDVPVIAVGNLSVGGTGKSPAIEYLIRLLGPEYRIATLSRGYKRNTKGFILANERATAESIGDEPLQFYRKFAGKGSNPSAFTIQVAVDADRKNGIETLLRQSPKPDLILLDDAFQHRRVRAGFYILLTAYGDLYTNDCMLPTGNLREGRRGARRADVIMVTKCPPGISPDRRKEIEKALAPAAHQKVFFSSIGYADAVCGEGREIPVSEIRDTAKLLLAGIAKPEPFFDFLLAPGDTVRRFADHHDFSDRDIAEIIVLAQGRPIVTTEKDYVRLRGKLPQLPLFYLPIQMDIHHSEAFDKAVQLFVHTGSSSKR